MKRWNKYKTNRATNLIQMAQVCCSQDGTKGSHNSQTS